VQLGGSRKARISRVVRVRSFQQRSNYLCAHCFSRDGCLRESQGIGPWTIQYESQYGSTRQKHTIKNIQSSPAKIEVPIPSKLDKSGGTFALSLIQVEDKRGCKRALQTTDLKIHVIRTKPTARFYGGKDRSRKIRQGQDVTLPLRLTGEAVRPVSIASCH
jgi:hypothetical protein